MLTGPMLSNSNHRNTLVEFKVLVSVIVNKNIFKIRDVLQEEFDFVFIFRFDNQMNLELLRVNSYGTHTA
ncbi:hypothetical protein PBCV1_a073L [Paramecium bursaria Chlorella virus 1]|uniref:Uncharacterized protein n=1 Tax=Paramecium bursaria Chlorella virus 1 TaxID=10506 RepID=Q89408_PBCV1|nr:hypothetical protein PBCV1_a073L [Paramecium bursaria Chlorella virus 1]AAC96441.1 hypothetical protein [Paramecium bursaria Chlorella virus 1]